MVHLGEPEDLVISTQDTIDRKDMQKKSAVESNNDERKFNNSSARNRNDGYEERPSRKEEYGRKSYRVDDYYNRNYQERDRFSRLKQMDYAHHKYREPASGRERNRGYDSEEDLKESSEAERSQGYSSREKYERNVKKPHYSETKSRGKKVVHEVPTEESSEEKDEVDKADKNSNAKLFSIERKRNSNSDRPKYRDYQAGGGNDRGNYGRSIKRNKEMRRDNKCVAMENSQHYRSRDDIDKGPESREESRYSRRRRDPVGEERTPGLPPPPPARPDSAASHRTSNSRATTHGYPSYSDYYKSSGSRRAPGSEMYDPQSYYYYYYQPYFEQHPKYRDYCQNYFKHYPHQYGAAGAPHSLPDERGSVRSGRSSAAEEVKKATLNSSRAMEGTPYYDPYGLYPHHQHDTSSQFLSDFHERSSLGGYEPSTIYAPHHDTYYQHPRSGEVSGRASVDIGAPRPSSQRLTPSLFLRPHTITRFTNTGQLLMVVPAGDSPATMLTVLSVREVLLQDGELRPHIRALETFPGPLTTEDTHKDKVVRFCEAKQQYYRDLCSSSSGGRSLELRKSRLLLWRYLALLVRQNGKLCPADLAALLVDSANEVLEEDVAKLALNNDEEEDKPDGDGRVGGREGEEGGGVERLTSSVSQTSLASSVHGPSTASSWDVSGAKQARGDSSWDVFRPPRSDVSRCVPQLSQQQLERVTQQLGELVCLGRRRDAVELAIEHRLWGHAMAIGSRMEQAVGGRVLSAFLQCLPQQDVLHTLVQQVNGKRPDVSKSYSRSRWGEWRRHLATLVANPSAVANRDVAAVIALGDSLATSDIAAGHICYLMGGGLSVWGHKLQLLGFDSSTASLGSLDYINSVQCTEVYEYGLNLASAALDTSGTSPAVVTLGGFARHKLRYATLLAEYGFFEQAVRYCEVLAGSLECPGGVASLPVEEQMPQVAQLQELASRLKYHDRHYLLGEGEIHDMPDPQWLTNLHVYYYHLQQHQAQGQQVQQTVEETQAVVQEGHVQEPQYLQQELPASTAEQPLQNGAHFVSSSAPLLAPEDAVAFTSPDTTKETHRTSLYDPRGEENAVPGEALSSGIPMVPTLPVEDHQSHEDTLQLQPTAVDAAADALQNFSFQPRMITTSSSAQENHAPGGESRGNPASYGEARDSEPSSPQFTPTHAPAQPYQMMSLPPYEGGDMYTSLPAELPTGYGEESLNPEPGTWGQTSLPSGGTPDVSSPSYQQDDSAAFVEAIPVNNPARGISLGSRPSMRAHINDATRKNLCGRRATRARVIRTAARVPATASSCIAQQSTRTTQHLRGVCPSDRATRACFADDDTDDDDQTVCETGDNCVSNIIGPSSDLVPCSPLVFGGSYPIDEPLSQRRLGTGHDSTELSARDTAYENNFGDEDNESDINDDTAALSSWISRRKPRDGFMNLLTGGSSHGCSRVTVSAPRTFQIDEVCCLAPNLCEQHAAAAAVVPSAATAGGTADAMQPTSADHNSHIQSVCKSSPNKCASIDGHSNYEKRDILMKDHMPNRKCSSSKLPPKQMTLMEKNTAEPEKNCSSPKPSRDVRSDDSLVTTYTPSVPPRSKYYQVSDSDGSVAATLDHQLPLAGNVRQPKLRLKHDGIMELGVDSFTSSQFGRECDDEEDTVEAYECDGEPLLEEDDCVYSEEQEDDYYDDSEIDYEMDAGDTVQTVKYNHDHRHIGRPQIYHRVETEGLVVRTENKRSVVREDVVEQVCRRRKTVAFREEPSVYCEPPARASQVIPDLAPTQRLVQDLQCQPLQNHQLYAQNQVHEDGHDVRSAHSHFIVQEENCNLIVAPTASEDTEMKEYVQYDRNSKSLDQSNIRGTDHFSCQRNCEVEKIKPGNVEHSGAPSALYSSEFSPACDQQEGTVMLKPREEQHDGRSFHQEELIPCQERQESQKQDFLEESRRRHTKQMQERHELRPSMGTQKQLQSNNQHLPWLQQQQQQQHLSQQAPSSTTPPAPTSSSSDAASKAGGSSDAVTKSEVTDGEKKGLFSRIFGWKNNQAKLPDDKNPSIVWDEERKRWVNTDGTEENDAPPPPPPMDSSLPLAPTGNRAGHRRPRYVNPVDEKHMAKPVASLVPPLPAQPSMVPQPQQQMMPQPQQQMVPQPQQQMVPQPQQQMVPQPQQQMVPQPQQQMVPQQQQQTMPQPQQQMMPQPQQQMMPQPQQQMMPQQQQQMMPQQQQQMISNQQQMMPQPVSSQQQTDVASAGGGAVSGHLATSRTRSDSSSIDLDDPDASASQDDVAVAAGTPMFFNPAQFQQPPQQLSAGRGRGAAAANARRGRSGGPQRRVFQSTGAAPPPPRA
ncbi:Ancestral coatomer element 1 Sec16/Sec31 [Trinorchestia longiramus]|nr:Ancestral coatomer element 1 Sec16/Sec31 [Trinorchestia longiramus]